MSYVVSRTHASAEALVRVRSLALVCGTFMTTLVACAGERADARDAVTRFYSVVNRTHITGAPAPDALDSLAPLITSELRQLLREARALSDSEARRAPDEKPPFAEGDLFTSLFEGHTRLEILHDSAVDETHHRVAVRFTFDATPPPVSWTDHVIVVAESGRFVIADVEYGGDWPMANKGSLLTSLKSALGKSTGGVTLPLKGGGSVTLADDTTPGDTYVVHQSRGHADRIPFHLVHASHVEGQSYRLVHDSTGRQLRIDAPPVVSPDARRFVTASMDLVAAFDPTRLTVWRLTSDSSVVEWSLEPEQWGPSAPQWQGNDTVVFTANYSTSRPDSVRRVPASLVFEGRRWRLRLP